MSTQPPMSLPDATGDSTLFNTDKPYCPCCGRDQVTLCQNACASWVDCRYEKCGVGGHVSMHPELEKFFLGKFTDGADRNAALESLWSSIKDDENWKIGYNPAFTKAVQRMQELEREG